MDLVRFSEKIDDIVPRDAEPRRLASGFVWSEGPVWDDATESVIFTDFTPEKIYRWSEHGGLSVFREQSGRAVGLAMDAEGGIVSCESRARRIARIRRDGSVVTLASHYEGKRLNSPNDVIVKSDGSVYFTDPYSTALGDTREVGQDGVYRVAGDGGRVTLLASLNRPNGLAFSPDERLLYVDDTNLQRVEVFEVEENGTLGGGRVLARLDPRMGKGGADGMKVDQRGNLYVTGPGGIWVIAPEGSILGLLRMPETAANLCWGGRDRTTLFITATTSLYGLRMGIPGDVKTP